MPSRVAVKGGAKGIGRRPRSPLPGRVRRLLSTVRPSLPTPASAAGRPKASRRFGPAGRVAREDLQSLVNRLVLRPPRHLDPRIIANRQVTEDAPALPIRHSPALARRLVAARVTSAPLTVAVPATAVGARSPSAAMWSFQHHWAKRRDDSTARHAQVDIGTDSGTPVSRVHVGKLNRREFVSSRARQRHSKRMISPSRAVRRAARRCASHRSAPFVITVSS
jgi:hypothetical protein